jgi:RNA polymerase sigma-70 factor (ECF subfamily)
LGSTKPDYSADVELVRRARRGDKRAFETLFRKYYQQLFNLLYRMVQNSEEASDLTQEAFIKAFRALPSLRDETTFYPWVRQIAVNLCRNFWKRNGRLRVSSLDETLTTEEGEELSREIPDWTENPEQLFQHQELREQLMKAIAELSPDHRTVILLHHLEGLPVADIAKTLGISVGTVKSRLARARDQLYRKLHRYVLPEEVKSQ